MKHTFVFHIIGLSRKIQKVIGFKAPPLLLSYSEASALLILGSLKNTTQKELAVRLHLEPASIVSLIDELEKSDLVKRVPPDGDRRKHKIILTEAGKKKLRQIKNRAYQLDNNLRSKLKNKEVASFFETLQKLTAYLDDWKGGENEIPSTKRHLAS